MSRLTSDPVWTVRGPSRVDHASAHIQPLSSGPSMLTLAVCIRVVFLPISQLRKLRSEEAEGFSRVPQQGVADPGVTWLFPLVGHIH